MEKQPSLAGKLWLVGAGPGRSRLADAARRTANNLNTAFTHTATGAQAASELTFTLNYLKPTEITPMLTAGIYVDTLTVSIESN